MCGRFTLAVKVHDLGPAFGIVGAIPPCPDPELELPRFNIAPTQPVLIVKQTQDGLRSASWARWGLIPGGAKDPRVGARMINARAETVFEQPAFRSAVRTRRCLVPTDGFFEWRKVGKEKQPFHVRAPGQALYAMAGIWSTWKDPTGAKIETCSILTTEPNAKLATLHDRMPVILPPEQYTLWLDPAEEDPAVLARLLVAAPEDALDLVAVSKAVNSVKNLGPECLEPVTEEDPPEPKAQLGLGFK
ncbi:MAG: SOS response-associated peptidase [Alphaproteobacteria bacterium]|nr:SOS response-associated peptidase [Alphaproteobacteria bacterium]